jgi:hypothetical protein
MRITTHSIETRRSSVRPRSWAAATAVQAGGSWPVHAGRLAEALEGADDGGEDIDPPRIGATHGEAG